MEFLKAPTDNLYKFISISGLAAVILSVLYAPLVLESKVKRFNDNKDRIDAYLAGIDDLGLRGVPLKDLEAFRMQFVTEALHDPPPPQQVLRAQNEQLAECDIILLKLSNLPAADDPDARPFWMDALGATDAQYEQWVNNIEGDNSITRMVKAARARRRSLSVIGSLQAENLDLGEAARKVRRLAFWGFWLGALVAISGGLLWYFKVQRHLDQVARNDSLRSAAPVAGAH